MVYFDLLFSLTAENSIVATVTAANTLFLFLWFLSDRISDNSARSPDT